MAINKKLITFDKKLTFLGANGINNLSSPVDGYYNLIPTWSMVFIKDTGEIWHDGVYFGKPIKDQIAPIMSGTTKGIVFTPNGTDYYYKDFNLWGNTFDGDTKNINGDLVVQGVTYKWTYGDLGIKKGNTNLISFSNSANDYDVFIPNGDLLVTGGDINVNNGKVILDSTGYIKGTHILNTNSYFNADNTLGKTWSSIKQFNTSGTTISLDTTRPAIINIQEHAHASGTLWVPWIAGGDITELSSWGIGLGGDAFYIGRIDKSHTENSLSEYWKFDATDGITISGATKYIKVADLSGASEKVFMADGTVKALSDITSEAVIGEATTTNYGGFKLTQDKASSQQSLVANTTGNGRYAVKMNANGTLYVEFSQANTWLPATNSQEGYVPQLSGTNEAIGSNLNDYVLMFTASDGDETIYPVWKRLPTNAFENTTYSTATSSELGLVKVGTTLDSTTGFTTVHIKDGKIYYKDTTYSFSNLKFQLTSGTDLMTYNSLAAKTILAGTGITFSYLNNVLTISSAIYSTATDSILGLVKVGTTVEDTTGYTKVHIDDSGFIYYHDTTYSFSKLKFQQTSGTDLMTYDSQAARTILAGDNITFTHSSNVLTIKATDTWTKFVGATDSSNGTAGYIDAPGKSNKNNFLRGDGTWLSLESNVTSALYVGASNGTSTAAQSTNGSVYLIFKEGSSYSRYLITGSGRASVTSDSSGNITISSSGYSNFTAATASTAGSAGLVPGPGANQLGSGGYYLKADGTWDIPTNTWKEVSTSQEGYVPKIVTTGSLTSSDNPFILVYKNVSGITKSVWVPLPANAFNNTWTAADFTNAGYVPKSVKGKFLHAKSDTGALEWVDDNNTWDAASTSKAGYVPKLATGGGTIASSDTAYVLAYKSGVSGTTAPVWILLPSNAYNNTWIANAVGVAGYVAAPTKAANANMVWKTNSEGVPAWRADANDNTEYYLTLNGTVNGTSGKTNLGTFYAIATSDTTTANQVWMRNSSNNGYGWRTLGSHAFDSTTYSTTDENVKLTPKTDNVNRPLMMINGGTSAGDLTSTSMFSTGIYANANTKMITASGFIKTGSGSTKVLLGDGSDKAISDFATSTHNHDDRYLRILGNLTSLGNGSDGILFNKATEYCTTTNLPYGSGLCYGSNGVEYTALFSKHPTNENYASILRWGYNDTYIYIARKENGTWKSNDWEKISAGYADSSNYANSAGNSDTVDGYHASSFLQRKDIRSDQDDPDNLRYNFGYFDKCDFNGTYASEYPACYGLYISLAYSDDNIAVLLFFDCPCCGKQSGPKPIYVRTRGAGTTYEYSPWGALAYLTDNVASATKLQTARLFTIGNTGKYFDGTANVSWTLAEIGVQPDKYLWSEEVVSPLDSTYGDSPINWAISYAQSHPRSFVYNFYGAEYSYLIGMNTNFSYGTILKMGYSDRYLRILRKADGTWLSSDWEKIYAGYADSAGDSSTLGGTSKSGLFTAFSLGASGDSTTGSITVGGTTRTSSVTVPYSSYTGRFKSHGVSNWDANNLTYPIAENYGQPGGSSNYPGGYGSVFQILASGGSSLGGQFFWNINHNSTASTGNLYFRAGNNLGWQNDWKRIAWASEIPNVNNRVPFTLVSAQQTDAWIRGQAINGTHIQVIYNSYGLEWTYWIGMNSNKVYGTILRISYDGWIQYCGKTGGAADTSAGWIGWFDVICSRGGQTINGNLTAANFYTTSDRSKKQNISSFSEHIRKFQLKDTEKWHYGVIAQEVEEMFRDGEEGNMTVNYNSVLSYYVGMLENKVKELEEKIKLLETK